jgi:hypothetical protein
MTVRPATEHPAAPVPSELQWLRMPDLATTSHGGGASFFEATIWGMLFYAMLILESGRGRGKSIWAASFWFFIRP